MRRWAVSAGLAAVLASGIVALPAAAAPSQTTLVVPGKRIGKIELGMTLRQVKRILGEPDYLVRRRNTGFSRYAEYDWGDARWTVGLSGPPGNMRVSLIATLLKRERTREGIGIGSTRDQLRNTYGRRLRCPEPRDPSYGIPTCRLGTPATGETYFPTKTICLVQAYACPSGMWRMLVYEVLIRNAGAPAPRYS